MQPLLLQVQLFLLQLILLLQEVLRRSWLLELLLILLQLQLLLLERHFRLRVLELLQAELLLLQLQLLLEVELLLLERRRLRHCGGRERQHQERKGKFLDHLCVSISLVSPLSPPARLRASSLLEPVQ
jgi:hypothetical protein